MMRDFVVNRNSWHYRLLRWRFESIYQWKEPIEIESLMPNNFCAYWNSVIFSILFLLVAIISISFLIIVGLIFLLKHIFEFLLVVGSIFAIFSLAFICLTLEDFLNREEYQKQPSLFKMKYTSWKNKIYPGIIYKD